MPSEIKFENMSHFYNQSHEGGHKTNSQNCVLYHMHVRQWTLSHIPYLCE